MLDAFGRDQFVGELLDSLCVAADSEHFETMIVVKMTVQRGNDHFAVLVLQIGKQILQMMMVMIVHQRDAAGDFAVAKLLMVLDKLCSDHVGDGQRPVIVTFFACHAV